MDNVLPTLVIQEIYLVIDQEGSSWHLDQVKEPPAREIPSKSHSQMKVEISTIDGLKLEPLDLTLGKRVTLKSPSIH